MLHCCLPLCQSDLRHEQWQQTRKNKVLPPAAGLLLASVQPIFLPKQYTESLMTNSIHSQALLATACTLLVASLCASLTYAQQQTGLLVIPKEHADSDCLHMHLPYQPIDSLLFCRAQEYSIAGSGRVQHQKAGLQPLP